MQGEEVSCLKVVNDFSSIFRFKPSRPTCSLIQTVLHMIHDHNLINEVEERPIEFADLAFKVFNLTFDSAGGFLPAIGQEIGDEPTGNSYQCRQYRNVG